jgi:CheY-like chemotaxis protein
MSERHVLVVEDDPLNARLLRKVLEKRGGCIVTVTEDPLEVLALARSGTIQLVVMDVSLHNSKLNGKLVSGLEICRMIKADPACLMVPIMLATAHAMRGDCESLLAESGADDYVSKPILDHEEFVSKALGLMERAA